jgi:putative transposase
MVAKSADVAIVFGSATSAAARSPASVRATCEAVGLPRSTYYYQSHRSHAAVELEHRLVLRLHELRADHPNDGYRRMTQLLQLEGFQVNRKRIARLMQIHCLGVRPSKPVGSASRTSQARAPLANLLATTRISAPNQAWIADIAYARIQTGLVYATAIIDAWLREVVGYAISLQISNRLASIALHTAVRAQRPAAGCIHHSTCGSHYILRGYPKLIREYGLRPSVAHPAGKPPASRTILEMAPYGSWRDVVQQSRAFIQDIYSPERVDALLQYHEPRARESLTPHLLPARHPGSHNSLRAPPSVPAGFSAHGYPLGVRRASVGLNSMCPLPPHNVRSENR